MSEKVQELKYQVLKEVIRRAYEGDLTTAIYEIPRVIVPGPKSDMRCCIYKERAVLEERVKSYPRRADERGEKQR